MYIPKSKIEPQIYYTAGGEYYYQSNTTQYINYVGFYHKDVYGNAWTGKEHTNESVLLISSTNSSSVGNDPNLAKNANAYAYATSVATTDIPSTPIPPNDSEPPTPINYSQGFYTRYIMQYTLSSKPIFAEVNKNTFYAYKNGLDSNYFIFAEVLWKISGPLYDQKENGILVKGGVIDSNKRSIQEAEKTMPGIQNYLTDLLLYYK